MSRPAAQAARQKAEHPEIYCPERDCLWRTGGGYCPRHAQRITTPEGPGVVVATRRQTIHLLGSKPRDLLWLMVDLDRGGRREFRADQL